MNKKQIDPIYLVSLNEEFKDYPSAMARLNKMGNRDGFRITYYMSQPKYKSWVPNWLIKLITI